MSIFSDQEDNGFDVRVWGGDFQSPVTHGGSHAIRLGTSGDDAFYVVAGRPDVTLGFSGMELWVHGGTTGGQSLLVSVKSGSATLVYASVEDLLGEPIPAGEWRRVFAPFESTSSGSELEVIMDGHGDLYVDDIALAVNVVGPCSPGAIAGSSCSDGNACNGSEVCDAEEQCLAGVPPALNDGNACTADTCSPGAGVVHLPVPQGTSCTYGEACQGLGQCDGAGLCLPSAEHTELRILDDWLEACFEDATTGVHDTAQSNDVHDGYRAASARSHELELYSASVSASYAGMQLWMKGAQPVTVFVWDSTRELARSEVLLTGPNLWQRVDVPFVSSSTPGELRVMLLLVDGAGPVYVDEVKLVASTNGACNGAPFGASCSDGDACNGEEYCDGLGTCVQGPPPPLDDGNACTLDTCDPGLGVLHTSTPVGSPCSDGNVCTANDACDGGGQCLAGVALDPDDGNPCTADACDPVLGVVHEPVGAGSSCSDRDACNGIESCNGAGVCTSSEPPVVNDGNVCTLDICDPVGGPVHTEVPGCETVPPDPVTVAPPNDPTVATDVAASTQFLYTGSDPIQVGVPEGTIEPSRVAIVRGAVMARGGGPLEAVTVRVLGHPEFGSTRTRPDGRFDLAVNGGGLVTIDYQKPGYIPAQRQVLAPWRDFVQAEDVVLIPYDPHATEVVFGAPDTQVASGSEVVDEDGVRQATVLFPAGTQALVTLPDGSTVPLGAVHVRATEYTVGEDGPQAMPAALPPASAYTYAVELSIDEAEALGATTVQFDRPVSMYVDNFLGFSVGGRVPTGFYDRTRGVWVPSDDGRVVQIVGVSGGLAELDTDGDALADGAETLGLLGVTNAERAWLAVSHPVGHSLWRVQLTHFSPYDCNWPYGCRGGPASCPPPKVPKGGPSPQPDDQCETSGSIIQCEAQVLGERVPLTGTKLALHYASRRARGYVAERSLKIPLVGASYVSDLNSVQLTVEIAGQRHVRSFLPSPGLSHTFVWDGKDAYGRDVWGSAEARIEIAYHYRPIYLQPSELSASFAAFSASGIEVGSYARTYVVVPMRYTAVLRHTPTPEASVAGWSFDVHHQYDVSGRRLLLGDGSERSLAAANIRTVAGGGERGSGADTGPATAAFLYLPSGIAVAPDGSLYVSDDETCTIRRVDPDGIMTRVAGTGICGPSEDGGPAIAAALSFDGSRTGIAVGADGSFFFTEARTGRIRRVGPDGIISTVAGGGSSREDGVPATAAWLELPIDLAAGPDGSLFFVEQNFRTVRRVGPDGIISTIAGAGTRGCSDGGDGGPARAASLDTPYGVAVGPDGALFIADTYCRRVRRVGPDGMITTVAGGGSEYEPLASDGGPAIGATLAGPHGVAVGPDGTLFIADWMGQPNWAAIRRVGVDGTITTVAGTGRQYGSWGDGGSPTQSSFQWPTRVAMGPDGWIYVADTRDGRVRAILALLPEASADDLVIASEDGTELLVFNAAGRHLRTLDALTGLPRFIFAYHPDGYLVSITDADGQVTTIERSGTTPIAVVAPHGQRTSITVGGDGYVSAITNPAGEPNGYTYDANGLMRTFTDSIGNVHAFTYDAEGLLTRDENPAGGWKSLTRSESDGAFAVSVETALGRTSSYRVESLSTGDTLRVNTAPDGSQSQLRRSTDGTVTSSLADGTVITTTSGPDPRFGLLAPVSSVRVATPGGRSLTVAESRTATLDPSGGTALGRTISVNGRAYRTTYSTAARTSTSTSPAGRTGTSVLDERGRLSQLQLPGVLPVVFSYDSSGRPSVVSQGARSFSIQYGADGYPQFITDPLLRSISFTYDPAGRVLSQTQAGRTVSYGYDRNGNLTSLAPPGRSAHAFGYTAVGLTANYTPPFEPGTSVLGTDYAYDLDGALLQALFPDQSTIAHGYDFAGRLAAVTTSRGSTTVTYDTAGRLATVTAPDGGVLAYGYDGSLITSESSSGAFSGTVAWTYDNDLRVASTSVNGSAIVLRYDADSLLTGAGALTISREASSGRVNGTTLGAVRSSAGYNQYGEVTSHGATVNGSSIYSYALTRDLAGRITEKSETVNRITDAYAYTYDDAGRLATVSKNGNQTASYAYDENGNRLVSANSTGTLVGTYDGQDRMTTYGGATYGYGLNGDLRTKVLGGQTTTYSYDEFGNLMGVWLPDGSAIEYVVDGRNRRVGKKVNGTLVEGFLYGGQLRPVAWLDGNGQVYARFVYGLHVNIPEYMVTSAGTFRFLTDHLGSPRLIVNASTGAVAQRIDYDEWGQVLLDSNPGFQPFGFAGGLYDRDTGLVRFGARDYDPSVGRWTAKDPIRFRGGTTNLYEYCASDPVNLVDPDGRFVVQVGAALIGGLVGASFAYLNGHPEQALQAFLVGAGAGLMASIPIPGLSAAASRILMGAVGGMAGNVLGQRLAYATPCGKQFDWDRDINWARVMYSGALGGIGGAFLPGVAEEIGSAAAATLTLSALIGVADSAVP